MTSNSLKFWSQPLKKFVNFIHEDIVSISCTVYRRSIMIKLTEDHAQFIGIFNDRSLTLLHTLAIFTSLAILDLSLFF